MVAEAPEQPSGPREGLILLVFAVLTLAASAMAIGSEEREAVDDAKEKAARGEVRGLDELSLVREDNLREVVAKVDGGAYPLVSTIRVSPERADVTASNDEGFQKILSFDPGLGVDERDFGTASSASQPVRAEKIDARGPERMVRAVGERTGLGPDAVDYVTASLDGRTEPTWFLQLERGPPRERQWIAAFDGSDLRRSGEIAPSQKAADERRRRAYERERQRMDRIFRQRTACLQRATTTQQITRCIERYAP